MLTPAESAQKVLDGYRSSNGDYVDLIEQHLTIEDRGQVWAEVTKYMYNDADRLGWKALCAMQDVARKVAEFVSLQHGNMAHWLADGLVELTGYDPMLRLSGSWNGGKDCGMSVQDLRNRIEEAQAEEQEEVDEGWDGGVFWDAETKALTESWLAQTPYAVWHAVNDVEEWAVDSFRESFFDMARGDSNGKSLANYCQERWQGYVKKWGEKWDKARQAA